MFLIFSLTFSHASLKFCSVDNVTGLEPDYLLRALESLSDQITAATAGKFAILVLNLRPGEHSVFATAQDKYAHDPHFVFAETFPDPEDEAKEELAEEDGLGGKEDDAGDGTDAIPLPGPRNRQQTRDVARLTRSVHARFDRSPYTLFIEDDFIFCEGSLSVLNGLVAHNNGVEMDWSAIRVSYGLCGLLMQRKDLLPFAGYLVELQYLRPVDILAYYWFARESSQRQPVSGLCIDQSVLGLFWVCSGSILGLFWPVSNPFWTYYGSIWYESVGGGRFCFPKRF